MGMERERWMYPELMKYTFLYVLTKPVSILKTMNGNNKK